MGKYCAWDNKEVAEEEHSHEDRDFVRVGKLALYFCNDDCQLSYFKDKAAHGGKGLYYIARRPDDP